MASPTKRGKPTDKDNVALLIICVKAGRTKTGGIDWQDVSKALGNGISPVAAEWRYKRLIKAHEAETAGIVGTTPSKSRKTDKATITTGTSSGTKRKRSKANTDDEEAEDADGVGKRIKNEEESPGV